MDQLLLPEKLQEIPQDLEQAWFAVSVPVGTRCLVISSRGQTVSRRKNGTILHSFQSGLPCGAPGRGG